VSAAAQTCPAASAGKHCINCLLVHACRECFPAAACMPSCLQFQQLAQADITVALAADVLHHFVAMLKAEQL
jgi:hypothetical protein